MARWKEADSLTSTGLPPDYPVFLKSLKRRVQQAQTKAMLSVNRELIQLFWDIGRLIVERQKHAGWGQSVLERLAYDLQKALSGVGGFPEATSSGCERITWLTVTWKQSHNLCDKRGAPKKSHSLCDNYRQPEAEFGPMAMASSEGMKG